MNGRRCLLYCFISLMPFFSIAQFPYSESFQNTTASNMVIAGSAKLTAATGVDPVGQGYLRLTDNNTMSVGYAYCQQAFPSSYGITASFEFFMWKSDAAGWNQADGISFFLFDASVNSFRPGGTGGSLGYANYYTTPGMAKGYLGIAIDGFGNFSSPTDGNKNGGPGQKRGSIAIRGPGNGNTTSDYIYQTGVVASDAPYNAGFMGFTQRYPLASSANYRKIEFVLTPGSSLGLNAGYTITVRMIKGGATPTTVTLINNFDYPFAAPAQLKFGLAGSTGAIYNYQEIRNMTITATNTASLLAPLLLPDIATICSGPVQLDPASNDASLNSGGQINRSTIDLNPSVAGQQTSYTDAGKGTYTLNPGGTVTFTPAGGFAGISSIPYTVADTYGVNAVLTSTLTVTVTSFSPPLLTLATPSAVCSPATINITNAAYRLTSSLGASYDYFASLADANDNTNNINATAAAIGTSGTYYVRANLLGCATIAPIPVQVSTPPSTANAGADQTFCSSTGGANATLLATNPATGTGTWTQISGPSTTAVNYVNASTSPLLNLDKGVYTYRWTVANGACTPSSDDIVLTVGVPSNAGTAQTICNATSATLASNAPSPGIGLWTRTAGPAMTITNTALESSAITGLVPGNNYTFSWKITNGACVSTTSVTITNVLNTIANAGIDKVISLTSVTLGGNTADAGNTGTWTIISKPAASNPVITSANSPTTGITGLNFSGDYVLRWTMVNGSFSNYDDMKITVTGLLPVKLISFSGSRENDEVKLTWKTASEENNDHFEIERSLDGIAFQTITNVMGSGTTSTVHNYNISDNISGITGNKIYYRLRQVDFDGHSWLSPVITITLPELMTVAVAPNPVGDAATLKINAVSAQKGQLTVYSAGGSVVLTQFISVNKGMNNIDIKGIAQMAPGVYAVMVKLGENVFTKQVIKN